MSNLYHGSSIMGLKILEPRLSTHGNYVYATPYKELAIIFSGRAGDDLTMSLFRNSKDEPWQLVERVPHGFDVMFANEASIYTVDDRTFKDIKTGFAEVVSEENVVVLNEEKIENLYDKLKELELNGTIKMYHYPTKPESIPTDDTDLIETELRHAKRHNEEITRETFERLLLLHPHLLEKINAVGFASNENFIPFQKEDLIDIFIKFSARQMVRPEKEFFLESAFTSTTSIYPEFTALLKEKMDELQKPRDSMSI